MESDPETRTNKAGPFGGARRNKARQEGRSRRDELEIIGDILEVSVEGVNKTRILYAANLSHRQMTRYLDMIERMGFIRRDGQPLRHWKTTKKGLELLRLLK